MAALARGEMASLAELVRRHQSQARTLAYRMLRRWDLADDVAQEAFLRVMRGAASYQPTARFSTWLYRIVVNLCHDQLRRARPMRLAAFEDDPPEAPTHDEAAGNAMLRLEASCAVRNAIAELPERQRVAVLLHRFQGLDHAAVAEVTGSTASAVESLLVRAYARLREQLKAWSDF
jgi:RNA polymerase sigma-70 factor (ECF subfamily)